MSRKELTEIEKTIQKRISALIHQEYKNNVSEFARCMGYKVPNCHAWIHGRCSIPVKKLYHIYEMHDRPLNYYFGVEDEDSNNTEC